ncbi:site-specific integrase [Cobetia sp. 29-18-1]|uniref:site-specific integrase n=1 Tax=Cobetia sp. 29-18-1 TaxID=3040018 RepID=UPI00244937F1|nr:site-specific integrase [Cobetia sp. 29-18-1]MDH2299481.1 site-specific integrase [Cobetia sp. 29-18-1]
MSTNTKEWPQERSADEKSVSKDGYVFYLDDNRWQLNKDVTLYLGKAAELPEPTQSGFRATLCRYAEEFSALHAYNMTNRFKKFLHDTGANSVSAEALLNWRSSLKKEGQWNIGGLKGFLLAWHDYGFPGVEKDVAKLLQEWRIQGYEKGKAVIISCPETGPLTDLEIQSLLNWANMAAAQKEVSLSEYAYFLTLTMTARRPVQIAALRGKDLLKGASCDISQHKIRIPRAKQRGVRFRHSFRTLAIIEDLYQVLKHLHLESVSQVERVIGHKLGSDLYDEIPIFINPKALKYISDAIDVTELLMGARPDTLHATTAQLARGLRNLSRLSQARSERTGEFIRLSATRFRYTRGTKLRREGFGAQVIAELLDHTDTQNVQVYCENTAQEAVIIDELVGAQLAPFAQACMGTLVWSEREAIRGSDPRSRVPNHRQEAVGTCGNYGFCASGYRACYTCHHFQPWVEGPHKEVLVELHEEKRRSQEAGCDELVVQANDQLILAVEHCVSLCERAERSDVLTEESNMERDDG